MAGMNTALTSSRQKLTAERIAGYGAEQRRLKEEAAARRAAAALRAATGAETDRNVPARPSRSPAVARGGVEG